MKTKIYALLTGMLCSSMAMAGGFQLNLQGLRQMNMGGSGVAVPWDVSAIFYNPGAFARLNGRQAYANVFMVSPHVKYIQTPTGGYSYESLSHTGTPFALYVGGNVDQANKWAVGLGVYTPFGNALHWEKDWVGRFLVQDIALQSIFFQPTMSYKLNDRLSLGAGLVYAYGKVEIEKAVPIQNMKGEDGSAILKGNAGGWGFNVGISYKASEKVDLGLSYRSGVKMDVKKGSTDFVVASPVAANFPNTQFSASLPLPGIVTAGVGYRPIEGLTLQGDLVYALWSSYQSLAFDFADNTPFLQDTDDPRDYKNTLAVRIGADYQISKTWEVMIGGSYDPTPSQDHLLSPDAVDANRFSLSGGLGFQPIELLTVMVGFNWTLTGTRTASYDPAAFTGAYQIRSFSPALGITYDF